MKFYVSKIYGYDRFRNRRVVRGYRKNLFVLCVYSERYPVEPGVWVCDSLARALGGFYWKDKDTARYHGVKVTLPRR